ncbi:MAG: hypothetical protein ACE5F5_05745 [Acidimicrobiia bacterium]
MKQLRRRGIVVLTVIGLLAFSGLALADSHDGEEPEDTTFNFAYDETNGFFLWGWALDEGLDTAGADCGLENGDVEVTYGDPDPEGGVISVTSTDIDEECGVSAAEVAGPNGQINHGQFMKLFNSLYDGEGGRGCLNRYLAQSDLGKGDQQVTVADLEAAAAEGDGDAAVVEGDGEPLMGDVSFFTFSADCQRGKKDKVSASSGKPASPGKSGEAPGHNK